VSQLFARICLYGLMYMCCVCVYVCAFVMDLCVTLIVVCMLKRAGVLYIPHAHMHTYIHTHTGHDPTTQRAFHLRLATRRASSPRSHPHGEPQPENSSSRHQWQWQEHCGGDD
jgi:hypothetical protein